MSISIIKYSDEYEVDVIKLLMQYSKVLSDDYITCNTVKACYESLQEMKSRIWIALDDEKFFGFFSIYDIYFNHSCYLVGASKRKINPQKTRAAFNMMLNILYNDFNFIKICATPNIDNIASQRILKNLNFKREGFIKGATLIDGKLKDRLLFSKINKKYLTNINTKKGY